MKKAKTNTGFQCEMITETGVPGESHNFDPIHKQSVSHTVVSITHRHLPDFYM
jgi:hypothetical protein